jgi:hypothetical protein
LAVAQAADAHWRYRMLASVVLMMYALVRAGAIVSEQSSRVVAHFASSAVGPLRQLCVIGRLATAWLLLHFKRHLTTGAELVTPSDDEVRAYAVRVPTDTSDDSDESALYFDGAPWVGRALNGDALACGVRFARGPVAFVAATQLPAGLRELESRFTDEQYLAKLCELAAVDRVAPDDEAGGRSGSGGGDSMSDMTGLAARMQAGMLMFSGRGGLQSQLGASTRCLRGWRTRRRARLAGRAVVRTCWRAPTAWRRYTTSAARKSWPWSCLLGSRGPRAAGRRRSARRHASS